MKTLNHHQLYLLEEFAGEYLARRMRRRELLRRSFLATGSVALTASTLVALGCGGDSNDNELTPTEAANIAQQPTAASSEPTAAPATPATTATAGLADPDIEYGPLTYPGPAGDIAAYLARPASDGFYAAIMVIHENRGLLPHFEDVCRRYAAEGFVALAPDLASRLGGTASAGQQVGQIPPEDLLADLQAGLDYLKAQEYVDTEALGVTGFCFGGGYTFDLAAASPDIKAAVPYYGTARRALETGLSETQAAVLVNYGANDSRITSEREDVEAALQASGQPYQITVHEGAGHAFFNDTGGNYNEAAATAAWDATLAWFREHLTA